jgi:transposase
MAFVMVLSYSRRLFLRFFPGQTTTHFLRGHVAALKAFGGAPRLILYDNLKSAVLDRRGDAIRFNPDLLSLCAHYGIEPRPVAPFRGNEKGRVERAIRYVRSAFFEALSWRTLDELNEKARRQGPFAMVPP